MSGLYQTRIDAHDHRRVGSHTLAGFPEYLRKAGYFSAAGCGYSAKTELNFRPRAKLFDGKDWKEAAPGQPIFAQITLYGTHRLDAAEKKWRAVRARSESPVDPDTVRIPPYFPDHKVVREDWALYLDQIQAMDAQVGEIVQRLRREGRYESSLILFCGDNGRCHLRGKNWLYDGGLHVPLIIKWPSDERFARRRGSVDESLVSMLDVPATVLEVARADGGTAIDGRSLASDDRKPRTHVFAARDGGGKVMDRIRCVREQRYKLIRNYRPELGYRESKYTRQHRPMLPVLRRLQSKGQLNAVQSLLLAARKPALELYDLEQDPHEVVNLAQDERHARLRSRLSKLLDAWITETGDTGLAEDR